ncbi:MAG: hypothetical protein GXP63_03075 [DPANN group archaeon]|nr:hypothetical protein [DPANN group archaeon]
MATTLKAKDRKACDTLLADTITAKILQKKRTLFLDCSDNRSSYLFHEKDLPFLVDSLFIEKIGRVDELIGQLETWEGNEQHQGYDILLISPFRDLLEQETGRKDEQQLIMARIEQLTEQAEQRGKEVLVLEVEESRETPT